MKNTYVRLREKVSRKVALVRHSYHEAISRNSFLESRSAGEDSRTKKKSANIGANTISGPKLAEQYKVIADYKKEDKWDLNLKAGTIVEVVEKSESGWWFVNIEDQQGWVPSTYLKRKDGNPENTSQRARQGEEEKYICTGEYTSQNADEISLDKGAVVDVIEKNLDGWWWVRYQDKEGWTPATYLMKAEKAHMERVARASGVQIVGQLSDISNLLKGEGNSSADGTTSSRPKLPPVLKKSRSLERGGSLRPPPRQNSIKNINLNAVTTQKLQSKNYVTLADFTDTVGDGISFKKGEFLEVIEKTDDGWWFVKIRGIEGWAPSTYIKTADIGEISEASCDPSMDPEYSCVPPPSDDEDSEYESCDPDNDEDLYDEVDPNSGYEVPRNKDDVAYSGQEMLRDTKCEVESGNDTNVRNSAVIRIKKGGAVKRPTSKPPPPPVIKVHKEESAEDNSDNKAFNIKTQLEAKFSSNSTKSDTATNKGLLPARPAKPNFQTSHTPAVTKPVSHGESLADILKSKFEKRLSSASESSSDDVHFNTYPKTQTGEKRNVTETNSLPIATGKKKPVTPPKSEKVLNAKRYSVQEESSELANVLKTRLEGRRYSDDPGQSYSVVDKSKKQFPSKPLIPPKTDALSSEKRTGQSDNKSGGTHSLRAIFEGGSTSKAQNFGKMEKKNSIKPLKKPPMKPQKPNLPAKIIENQEKSPNSARKSGFAKELSNKLSTNISSLNSSSPSKPSEVVKEDNFSANKPPLPKKSFLPTSGWSNQKKSTSDKKCYRAIADFTGKGEGEISFTAGDMMEVEDKTDGWWLVNVHKRQGWAPATYIEELDSVKLSSERSPSPTCDSGFTSPEEGSNSVSSQKYRTCAEFFPEGYGEIGFSEGKFVDVLDCSEDDWWYVRIDQNEGWVPANFLEEV